MYPWLFAKLRDPHIGWKIDRVEMNTDHLALPGGAE